MAVNRRAALSSAEHAEIPTPGVRRYVPSIPIPPHSPTASSTSTTSTAELRRTHPLAQEERSRWAGAHASPTTPPPSAATSRRPLNAAAVPLFPLPLDCATAVARAAHAFAHGTDPLLTPSLRALSTVASTLATVNSSLIEQSARLSAASAALPAGAAEAHAVLTRATADFSRLHDIFLSTTAPVLTALTSALTVTSTSAISLSSSSSSSSPTIPSVARAFSSMKALPSSPSLSTLIRAEIDTSRYPRLAASFILPDHYRLDGSRRDSISIARDVAHRGRGHHGRPGTGRLLGIDMGALREPPPPSRRSTDARPLGMGLCTRRVGTMLHDEDEDEDVSNDEDDEDDADENNNKNERKLNLVGRSVGSGNSAMCGRVAKARRTALLLRKQSRSLADGRRSFRIDGPDDGARGRDVQSPSVDTGDGATRSTGRMGSPVRRRALPTVVELDDD